jgi:hypothetical protein
MYSNVEFQHARQRQQNLIERATAERQAHRARQLSRATRRAERAERQLSRSWSEAARLRAQLTRLASDPWH